MLKYINIEELAFKDLQHAELLDLDRRLAALAAGEQIAYLQQIKAQLAKGLPYAYCVESASFRELDLWVTKDVLIPRPETELMPDIVGQEWGALGLASQDRSPQRILDIGTGSGCLAIALARMYPAAYLEAWDVSDKALEVATKNAETYGCKPNFRQVDVFSSDAEGNKAFDLIVSNPPYISHGEVGGDLAENVLVHEPHLALFGGETGLSYYQRFRELFPKILTPTGFALLEHGHLQSKQLQKVFFGQFSNVKPFRDLSQKDRFLLLAL